MSPLARESIAEGTLRQLAAAHAHEARNRLNPMSIHLDLLRARLDELAAGRADALAAATRSLEVLRQEVGRLDRIITDYVRWAGPVDGEPVPVDLGALMAEAAERAAGPAKRRGVTIEVENESPTGSVSLDAAPLLLALDALLANAAEASSRGGRVTLRARSDEGAVVLEVEDRGGGLDPATLARAFQIGFSTRRGHAGVGLAVAKHAVRAHPGAQLALQSPGPGLGTIARIELPLDDE